MYVILRICMLEMCLNLISKEYYIELVFVCLDINLNNILKFYLYVDIINWYKII